MKKEYIFQKGDKVVCLDGTDSHGLLRKGKKYRVRETDGITVALEDVSLTWANIRFKPTK